MKVHCLTAVAAEMNLLSRWFWPRSARREALALCKSGMASAERNDTTRAMVAYTAVIEKSDAPDDVKAMALYNRALLFAAAGDIEKELADLDLVMKMAGPLPSIKLAARRRLQRLVNRKDAVAARENRQSAT